MPKTIIKIKTWGCECGYHQDFEPIAEKMHAIFNLDEEFVHKLHKRNKARISEKLMKGEKITSQATSITENKCPNCALNGTDGNLVVETDPSRKTTFTIIGEEDIEDEINPEKPNKVKHGMPVNTDTEKEAYRVRRRKDIADAIKEARKLEDK